METGVEQIFIAAGDADDPHAVLSLARAVRETRPTTIVGPRCSRVVDCAAKDGFPTVGVAGGRKRGYMANLRAWSVKARVGWLWCYGLVPALATSGHRQRVVHIGAKRNGAEAAALGMARLRTDALVLPTQAQAAAVAGARVLWDWVPEEKRSSRGWVSSVVTIGRPSGSLSDVLPRLQRTDPGRFRVATTGDAMDAELSILIADTPVDVMRAMSARIPFVLADPELLEISGRDHRWVGGELDQTIRSCACGYTLAELDDAWARWAAEFSPEAGARRVDELLRDLAA